MNGCFECWGDLANVTSARLPTEQYLAYGVIGWSLVFWWQQCKSSRATSLYSLHTLKYLATLRTQGVSVFLQESSVLCM